MGTIKFKKIKVQLIMTRLISSSPITDSAKPLPISEIERVSRKVSTVYGNSMAQNSSDDEDTIDVITYYTKYEAEKKDQESKTIYLNSMKHKIDTAHMEIQDLLLDLEED